MPLREMLLVLLRMVITYLVIFSMPIVFSELYLHGNNQLDDTLDGNLVNVTDLTIRNTV